MNDDELDRMVAAAAPITDGQVASLGLRDAATELMEEIMATTTDDTAGEVRLVRKAPSPPRRRTRYAVAGAAAVALAVTTAAVLAARGSQGGDTDQRDDDITASGPAELPHLVPEDLPAGLDASEASEHGDLDWLDNSVFYGRAPEGGMPVVDLAVSWVNGTDDATFEPGAGFQPVTVRGREGYACTGTACAQLGPGVRAGLEWTERPGHLFSLESPTLTVGQLVAVADGLVIGGHDEPAEWPAPSFVIELDDVNVGAVPGDLVVPLDELGRRNHQGPQGEPTPDSDPGPPNLIQLWYSLDDPASTLLVRVEAGDGLDIAAIVARDAAEPIADVRGHPAWSVTLPPGPTDLGGVAEVERRRIVWQEAPGVMVTVETSGTPYDVEVLRDVAESLRPVTDAEWQDLRDQIVPTEG